MTANARVESFVVKDCSLLTMATGRKAQNLKEMKDHSLNIHCGSIYHHFWGGLLGPGFDEPECNSDFAGWVHDALQDQILAERLSVVNPAAFTDLESLHEAMLEVIEEMLDEIGTVPWPKLTEIVN